MSFSSFFRREIHNQQHWLDMTKKSQNGYKAKKLWSPKHYKHVTPCKNTFSLFLTQIRRCFVLNSVRFKVCIRILLVVL